MGMDLEIKNMHYHQKPPFVIEVHKKVCRGYHDYLRESRRVLEYHLDAVRAFGYRGEEFLVTLATLVFFVSHKLYSRMEWKTFTTRPDLDRGVYLTEYQTPQHISKFINGKIALHTIWPPYNIGFKMASLVSIINCIIIFGR